MALLPSLDVDPLTRARDVGGAVACVVPRVQGRRRRRWVCLASAFLLSVVGHDAAAQALASRRAHSVGEAGVRVPLGLNLRVRMSRQVELGVVRLYVSRFGTDPVCAAAFVADADGLLLTSYQAIRGADSLSVFELGRRTSGAVRVAGYDVPSDVAVLQASGVTSGAALRLGNDASPGDTVTVWGFGADDDATGVRVSIVERDSAATLRLSQSARPCSSGGPVTDRAGFVVAISKGGGSVVPISRSAEPLLEARRNVFAGNTLSVADVATRERHTFGSVEIGTDEAGSIIRVTPLETWHWPAAAAQGLEPLTFAGPMGRYRAEVIWNQEVRGQETLDVQPGTLLRVRIFGVATSGGGKFPFAVTGIGAAAGGAAALLLLSGGGGGGEPIGPSPGQTGGIRIRIPVPSSTGSPTASASYRPRRRS